MSGLRRVYINGEASAEAQLKQADGALTGSVSIDDEEHVVEAVARRISDRRIEVRVGDRRLRATVVSRGDTAWVCIDGASVRLELAEPGARSAATGADAVSATSPMSGVVAKMSVETGAHVASGDELFVVEAMKMEYVVSAPRDVVIGAVHFNTGDRVELGDDVVAFEAVDVQDDAQDDAQDEAPQ